MKTKLQLALANMSHDEAMVLWHAIAQFVENVETDSDREEVELEADPELNAAKSAQAKLDEAVASAAE